MSYHPTKPHITFKNNVIAYSSELKFLGLCITETLTWQAQIHSLCTILSRSYYMIKSLKNVTSTQTIWNTYFAHFESRLRYGIMFWGGDGKSIRIFQLQKKVIKLITGVHKRKSCRPIFRKFKILTLASLYIFEMLNFLKKYQGNVKQNLEIHDHNTRKKHDLHTRHCNTVLYQKSVVNMGIKLFNKLPIQIKQLDNYKSFKREVKTFLVQNSFYTIEEFLNFEGF
jgi:hypothetical protein